MIVGVGGWGFRNLPFQEHCRIARDFGFHYLEMGIGGNFPGMLPSEMSPQEIKEIRTCIAEHGLEVPFVCLENDFTLPDPDALARMVERTLGEIRLAHALGATHVRLFSGIALSSDMTEERWQLMLDAFRQADALCESLGMVIGIETHGQLTVRGDGFVHRHTTSTDWASLERLLRELPSRVGFNFDPGNLKAVSDRPLVEYARLLGNRVNYCHLKDWTRKDDYWVACGVGDDDIDWKALLDATDFTGVYLIEYEPLDDTEDGIRRSLEHLRSLYPDLRLG